MLAFILLGTHNMQNDDMSGDKVMGMGMRRYPGYGAIRALTAIIVLIFVFWCGFQFGEMRASIGPIRGGYGYGMMTGGGYYGGGMMDGYYGSRGVITPAAGVNGSTAAGGATAPVQNAK